MAAAITMMPESIEILYTIIRTAPPSPGVYQMRNRKGETLYVGKAKHLAKRLQSYTQWERLTLRLQHMVSQIHDVILTVASSESEALLLEASLIKSLKPRYNILLRDDKTYPFICIDHTHPYPQIIKYRGKKKQAGHSYFGPFASAGDVNRTIAILQKLFLLRPCSDSYFANRKHPCLQYQIKRCSAPCVGKVTEKEYADNLQQALFFLQGKSDAIQKMLMQAMEEASSRLAYEEAALYRNRLRALAQVQAHQSVHVSQISDADVIGLVQEGSTTVIQIFFFRGGQHYGNRHFFPLHTEEMDPASILGGFLGQFYQTHTPPKEILVSHLPADADILAQALSTLAESKVVLRQPKAGDKRRVLQMALDNAQEALERHLKSLTTIQEQLEALTEQFQLPTIPERIEVFDNSHTLGEQAVGAMIVAGPEGFIPNEYRHFFFDRKEGATGGDDYALLRKMLTKRLEKDYSKTQLWLIDGGKNHLQIAEELLKQKNVTHITCIAIAKGPDRHAGREICYTSHLPPHQLTPHDALSHYLQRLRDEAHRFAITTHRARRSKNLTTSEIDHIPGIGPIFKKRLLAYFGSLSAITSVALQDLQKVPGIGQNKAQIIYDYLHPKK